MHRPMQNFLSFLGRPELALGEACKLISANPRRVTVWLQRSDAKMPVPGGVLTSERKRIFTGAEMLQLAVLTRLAEWTDASSAAIWAHHAVDAMKHGEALARPFSPKGILALGDIGLFVYSSVGRE